MKLRNALIASSSLLGAISAPALATVSVYTSASAFTNATTGTTTYAFPFAGAGGGTSIGTAYTLGPATFSSTNLFSYDDAYGTPYLGSTGAIAVDTTTSAIGLYFGSFWSGAFTVTYTANGDTGTFYVPDTAFFGFTSSSGPLTLTFSQPAGTELDITQFITGSSAAPVPEPDTWALMIVGFGAIGVWRRKRKVKAPALQRV
ncbi:MAG: PEPxxWA-CTERM sorting domain-containing protein [Pseudomonadota bacterium]|jgi:PEP-CTERM motif